MMTVIGCVREKTRSFFYRGGARKPSLVVPYPTADSHPSRVLISIAPPYTPAYERAYIILLLFSGIWHTARSIVASTDTFFLPGTIASRVANRDRSAFRSGVRKKSSPYKNR